MLFRVYLRTADQMVSAKTVTGDPVAAVAAFESLVNQSDLDGQKVLAVLNRDGAPVAHHNFERYDSQRNWRGRIGEINLSKKS